MEQEVYVDLYFIINTCMNLLTLMITATLLHRKVSRLRAWIAAAVGGGWAVLALFSDMGDFGMILCDGAIIFLMSYIVFATKKASFQTLLKCTVVGVLTSMILGGVTKIFLAWSDIWLVHSALNLWCFHCLFKRYPHFCVFSPLTL